jgi:hypothetical protein
MANMMPRDRMVVFMKYGKEESLVVDHEELGGDPGAAQ